MRHPTPICHPPAALVLLVRNYPDTLERLEKVAEGSGKPTKGEKPEKERPTLA
jgi:hypothetical protein